MDVRKDNKISSYPHLVAREAVAALSVLVLLFFASLLLDAPLGPEAAGDAAAPAEAKAPWFFTGIQGLLRISPAILAGIVIPALILAVIAAIPFAGHERGRGENEPLSYGLPAYVRILFLLLVLVFAGWTLWCYIEP